MDRVSDKVGYDVMEINDKMTLWTQVNTPKETEKSLFLMIMSTHQIKSNQRQPIISQTEDITIFNQSISVNLIIMYPRN